MGPVWEDPRVRRGMAAQLELRRQRLAEGARPLGWKVAFGSPQVRELLRIEAPLTGFLTSHSLLEPGATCSVAGWTKPALEPEIAVHMGRDLGPAAVREETQSAIAALGPAVELADVDPPPEEGTLERIVAQNIFHRGVILGASDTGRAGGSVESLSARVLCDGSEIAATDDPEAFTGNLVDIVGHVAGLLDAFGERLRAGDVVITGTVVPHVWPVPGQRIEFHLEPLGQLDVAFE
jgi:2-keto-4-pentenoate hydratase